jgi:WD40 repeat protein
MPTIAPLDIGCHALAAVFIHDRAVFAGVDGVLHMIDGAHRALKLHDGMTVAEVSADATSMLTGGEDGRVLLVKANPEGTGLVPTEIAVLPRKWIGQVAFGPNGALGWASGKTAFVREASGKTHELIHARTVEGLAFFPKGLRLACAHYDGVSLHYPGTKGGTHILPWKGAHLNTTIHPAGDYVITAMQENALHGWKLPEKKDLRMSGYPAKTKSLSWAPKGRYLATSGAPAAIVWPFLAKDGPMGKAPLELGTRGDSMVTTVACHPTEDLVTIGYQDGMILLVRFSDAREVLLRRNEENANGAAITALGWDKYGARLAYGSENGACGVVDLRP